MSERMTVGDTCEMQTAAQQAQCFMEEFNTVYVADGLPAQEKIARLNDLAHREAAFVDTDPLAYATHMLAVASRQMSSDAAGYIRNLSRSVVVQVAENGTPIDDLVRLAQSSRRQTKSPKAALLATEIVEFGTAIKRDLGEKRSADRKVVRDAAVDVMKVSVKAASDKAVEVTKKIGHDLPIAPVARATAAGTALAAIATGMTFTQTAAASELPTSIPARMMQASSAYEVQVAGDDDVISIPGVHFNTPEEYVDAVNPGEVEPQAPALDDDNIALPPGVSVDPPATAPHPEVENDDVIPLPPGTEIVSPQPTPELKDDEIIPLPPGAVLVPPAPTPTPSQPAPGQTPPEMPVIPPSERAPEQPVQPTKPKVTGWGEGVGGKQELTYFNQMDDKWRHVPYRKGNNPEAKGTIAECGCGPVSFATAISTMTSRDTDPEKIAAWFMDHSGPLSDTNCSSNWIWSSNPQAFKEDFGLDIKTIVSSNDSNEPGGLYDARDFGKTDAALKKALDSGGMVLMSQRAGTFTKGGHILLITGYTTAEDGSHRYIVADPNSTERTNNLEGFTPLQVIGDNTPVDGVEYGGAGADRGDLRAAWVITPAKADVKPAPTESGAADKRIDEYDINDHNKEFLKKVINAAAKLDSDKRLPVNLEVMIAQSFHESGWGKSDLASKYNNLFGMKAGGSWKGETVDLPTWEVINGKRIETTATWRVYDSYEDSMRDYAYEFIGKKSHYADAVAHKDNASKFLDGLLAKLDVDGTIIIPQGKEGAMSYATDPEYKAKILKAIDSYELSNLVALATGGEVAGDDKSPEDKRLEKVHIKMAEALQSNQSWDNAAYPIKGNHAITSRIGVRAGGTNYHRGIDFGAPVGMEFYSMFDGVVTTSKVNTDTPACNALLAKLGKTNRSAKEAIQLNVFVTSQVDGKMVTIYYGHLSEFKVKNGQTVKSGDVIGLSGDTGCSTGPHAHIEASEVKMPGDKITHKSVVDVVNKALGKIKPGSHTDDVVTDFEGRIKGGVKPTAGRIEEYSDEALESALQSSDASHVDLIEMLHTQEALEAEDTRRIERELFDTSSPHEATKPRYDEGAVGMLKITHEDVVSAESKMKKGKVVRGRVATDESRIKRQSEMAASIELEKLMREVAIDQQLERLSSR